MRRFILTLYRAAPIPGQASRTFGFTTLEWPDVDYLCGACRCANRTEYAAKNYLRIALERPDMALEREGRATTMLSDQTTILVGGVSWAEGKRIQYWLTDILQCPLKLAVLIEREKQHEQPQPAAGDDPGHGG